MLLLKKRPHRNLERALGYRFRQTDLLETALRHPSFCFETMPESRDNERLEFLGDAALTLVVAEHLYARFPELEEGGLTALRSRITSGNMLSRVAHDIRLGPHLKIGKGEEKTGGRNRPSNLEDALESVMGAAYLDGGIRAVRKIFQKIFAAHLATLTPDKWADNPKGKLQDYAQRVCRETPEYRIIRREGPAHAAIFTAEVRVGNTLRGIGRGRSKQEAEIRAAQDALRHVPVKEPPVRSGRSSGVSASSRS